MLSTGIVPDPYRQQSENMTTLLTLNLQFQESVHGEWLQRRELIDRLVRENDPDVAVFQSVRVRSDPMFRYASQLIGTTDGYPYSVFEPIAGGEEFTDGMMILSKKEFIEKEVIPLSWVIGSPDPASRCVIRVKIRDPEEDFHLFVVHFSWEEEQVRKNIREALAFAELTNGPAVLAGDFNLSPEAPFIQFFYRSGWLDAWELVCPGDPGYTFESHAPDRRIDYVWTRGLVPVGASVVGLEVEGVRQSDHLGVFVQFRAASGESSSRSA